MTPEIAIIALSAIGSAANFIITYRFCAQVKRADSKYEEMQEQMESLKRINKAPSADHVECSVCHLTVARHSPGPNGPVCANCGGQS